MDLDIDASVAHQLRDQIQHVLQHHWQEGEVVTVHACRLHDPAVTTTHRLFYRGGEHAFILAVRRPPRDGAVRVVLQTCREVGGEAQCTARLLEIPVPVNDVFAVPCTVCEFTVRQAMEAGAREAMATAGQP